MIDDLTVHNGYGAWRAAAFLNEAGYTTGSGEKFTGKKICTILKDTYYCGRLEDSSTSPALQALRIRSDETHSKIMYILEQRSRNGEEKGHVAMRTQGWTMLSGNVFVPTVAGGWCALPIRTVTQGQTVLCIL